MKKTKTSEFRAYPWILKNLKLKDWHTSNPNKNAKGEVWTQNECLEEPEIKKALGKQKPENVIKIEQNVFWVIEAKEGKTNIDKAVKEAKEYADSINSISGISSCPIASGISGNEEEGFDVKNFIFIKGVWNEIKLGKFPLSRLLSKVELLRLIAKPTFNLERPELTVAEVVLLSRQINETLHIAKVEKEKRAPYVAALLLALNEDHTISLKGNAGVFIEDINNRAKQVFKSSGKDSLLDAVKIQSTGENKDILAQALNSIINFLKRADILSAAVETDILGVFFENFLRYGNTSKDLGIVLTPRHICWLATEALEIKETDFVYDCSVGTGGFLISSFNKIKETVTAKAAKKFAAQNLFGVEAQSRVAALAFINMYFRGDGKHNLKVDSCFNWRLVGKTKAAVKPTYSEGRNVEKKDSLLVNKVLMNPPFSLKDDKEKEPDFIDHALSQLQDKGLLFTVLPSSVMYEIKHKKWRKLLLEKHTIKAVTLFVPDLFYPVSTETLGLFIQKGVPHDKDVEVLWGRITDDGLIKKKGFRIEKEKISFKKVLETHTKYLKSWINYNTKFPEIPGELEYKKLKSEEIIPQVHLGIPKLDATLFDIEIKNQFKSLTSQLWEQLDQNIQI